ncbi:cation:proton antiporter [Nocardiopsis lambiniae]|uniref:Cation:proton antiporter n=1 Tax=Nocardiopsis lambiniae TaxID=3075539 RepID=A0ABU2MAG0_9ACTN|nr:cation:proton antiporter [Nocardiopsis sp. DSM 44743]MDT0328956.1 cation:proton antiporter [Nocardiopsis sp. DSM 44743]
MDGAESGTMGMLLALLVAALLAPLIGHRLARWVIVPSVVLEIGFGILLGPSVLGIVRENATITLLADLGLALLMFMAGYEIDFRRIKGRPLNRALLAWACSVALGLGIGWALFGASRTALIVGLALTTTALGTVLPILRDSGALGGAFGTRFLASGSVGEFGPIVLIALLLSGYRPWEGTLLLALFFALAGAAAWAATRPRSERWALLIRATLGSSAQVAVRLCMVVIVALVWLASAMHLDALLGSFAAGIVVKLMISANHEGEAERVESKMDAIGFGFLIPVFFVVTGVRFDLASLLAEPVLLLLPPVLLVAFLLVRGGPEYLFSRGDVPEAQRPALVLFSATALPLLTVLTTIGTRDGSMDGAHAAAIVAAGMLSVLILPQAGGALLRRTAGTAAPAERSREEE